MPGVREFLLRLRPAGAPGAAAAAGVPSDAVSRANDELEPVFTALLPALREARRLRAEATDRTAEITSTGREQARVLLAQARADAAVERARVAAELMARTEREVSGFLERARTEAAEVEREAALRSPERAANVVARVKLDLSTLEGEAG